MAQSQKPNRKRGFQNFSPERRREIAAAGGRASRGGGRPPVRKYIKEEK